MATLAPNPTKYEPVIGLEVHVQLKTATKLFCSCSTAFGEEPNQNTCPICLGMPGVLPVLNQQALDYAVLTGLALNCTITPLSKFDRKQYFYPDLPKGYQISQYDLPVCQNGWLEIGGKKIRIHRAHLEEDAGKLVHVGSAGLAGADYSLVDLNRAGTPLLEIVSEPDIRSAEEAREYMEKLRSIVRYLGVCDGNLEEGSMRCDANVSLRPVGQEEYGTKAEIKNMNSFRSLQRAIESEIVRQAELLDAGERVIQESRLWNEATGTTMPMRSKEEAHDYRYFPEPDLRPLSIEAAYIETLRATMPELPVQRYDRLVNQFGLSDYDANTLTEFKELGDFFDQAVEHTAHYKALTNWLMGDITGYMKANNKSLEDLKLTPEALAELVELVDKGELSSALAKKVLPDLLEGGGMPSAIMKEKGLSQITDDGALKEICQKVMAENQGQVDAFRSGKDKLFGFFVGQVMKATQGTAHPEKVNEILLALLKNP